MWFLDADERERDASPQKSPQACLILELCWGKNNSMPLYLFSATVKAAELSHGVSQWSCKLKSSSSHIACHCHPRCDTAGWLGASWSKVKVCDHRKEINETSSDTGLFSWVLLENEREECSRMLVRVIEMAL